MMRRYAFIIGFCLNSIYCIASKGKAQTYILYANAAHSKDKKRGNLYGLLISAACNSRHVDNQSTAAILRILSKRCIKD